MEKQKPRYRLLYMSKSSWFDMVTPKGFIKSIISQENSSGEKYDYDQKIIGVFYIIEK